MSLPLHLLSPEPSTAEVKKSAREERRLGSLTEVSSLAEHTCSAQHVGAVDVVCNYNPQGNGQVHL